MAATTSTATATAAAAAAAAADEPVNVPAREGHVQDVGPDVGALHRERTLTGAGLLAPLHGDGLCNLAAVSAERLGHSAERQSDGALDLDRLANGIP